MTFPLIRIRTCTRRFWVQSPKVPFNKQVIIGHFLITMPMTDPNSFLQGGGQALSGQIRFIKDLDFVYWSRRLEPKYNWTCPWVNDNTNKSPDSRLMTKLRWAFSSRKTFSLAKNYTLHKTVGTSTRLTSKPNPQIQRFRPKLASFYALSVTFQPFQGPRKAIEGLKPENLKVFVGA